MNDLLKTLESQYNEGQDFLRSRKTRQVKQLALMNNLQRGDEKIASTMLPSLFNRVHSSLYSDVPTVRFVPPDDTDFKKTEALNKLQVNDYREMEKWQIDYDWLWNTLFYGDGFVNTWGWDSRNKIMKPEVWNNLMMIYDPYFAEPKEWRYFGQWLTKSGAQLRQLEKAGLLEPNFDIRTLQAGFDPDIWSYKSQHDSARMGTPVAESSYARHNNIYQIFEQYTFDNEGNRWIFWTDKGFSKILRRKKLNLKDEDPWPLVRKQIFREPNSSISISIPDMIEDKHRAKSVLYNLMYISAKDEANPTYLYNPEIVKDVSQFLQRQVEQHIPVDDIERAAKRMNTGQSTSPSLLQFVSMLNTESSEVVGTTMVQPISPKGKKSATESALAQQIADQAAALQSKILGAGEKEFWSHWYRQYLRNMKQADEKLITIVGVTMPSFEKVKLEDIKTKYPPKIEIMSQRDADYKELVMRRDLMQIYPAIQGEMDPKAKMAFDKFVFYPRFIKDSTTIDRIIPKSLDELKAEEENDILDQNKITPVAPTDDDGVHIYSHRNAKNTAAKWAHILTHEHQLAQKKQQQEQVQQQGQEQLKNYTANNMEGAVPLSQETGDHLAKSSLTMTK